MSNPPCEDDVRIEANRICAAAVRNTVLEDYHARGAITDREMKRLMIEVCSNLEFVLLRRELMPRGEYMEWLREAGSSADRWERRKRTGHLWAWHRALGRRCRRQ